MVPICWAVRHIRSPSTLSRLLTWIPMLLVFQNLRWSSNKMTLWTSYISTIGLKQIISQKSRFHFCLLSLIIPPPLSVLWRWGNWLRNRFSSRTQSLAVCCGVRVTGLPGWATSGPEIGQSKFVLIGQNWDFGWKNEFKMLYLNIISAISWVF